MPTRSELGARSRNDCIALLAAASRVGFTSVARIEPEVSTTSTTLARSFGALTVTVGRANATQSDASAASSNAAGTCLRHGAAAPRDPGEHCEVRVAHRVLRRAPLQEPVAGGGERHQQERREERGSLEAHLAPREQRLWSWSSTARLCGTVGATVAVATTRRPVTTRRTVTARRSVRPGSASVRKA